MISDAFCSVIVRQHHPDLLGVDGAPDRPPPCQRGRGCTLCTWTRGGSDIRISEISLIAKLSQTIVRVIRLEPKPKRHMVV